MDYSKLGLDASLVDAVKTITEASCSSKKMEKEEMHPNQKKLDKNKNGKLDSQDFKMLRKEEEEVKATDKLTKEQIEEIEALAAKHGLTEE